MARAICSAAMPTPPLAPLHQYGFGSVRLRRVMQGVIGGSVGHPDSRALLEVDFRRKRMHLRFERTCIFRIGTGDGPRGVDAIAALHLLDAVANRFDDAGAVRSRRVWERRLRCIGAGTHVGVVGIDPRRVDAHHDFAGRRFWCGHLLQLEDLGAAELMNANRFHFQVSKFRNYFSVGLYLKYLSVGPYLMASSADRKDSNVRA
jgi:glyoxylate carboligase